LISVIESQFSLSTAGNVQLELQCSSATLKIDRSSTELMVTECFSSEASFGVVPTMCVQIFY